VHSRKSAKIAFLRSKQAKSHAGLKKAWIDMTNNAHWTEQCQLVKTMTTSNTSNIA
jgi:hypothetical protein